MIGLLAALAMVAQDIVLTVMVQCEARNRALLAGALDSVGWLLGLAIQYVALNSLLKHGLDAASLWIISAVTVANFVGTSAGVRIGKQWIRPLPCELTQRVEAIEEAMAK